jgi:hypothetical protein
LRRWSSCKREGHGDLVASDESRPGIDALRSEVVAATRGREVFHPDAADARTRRPGGPCRFDNLLLAHQDRTRFVPAAARKAVYLPLRIAATVLIDGFVGATWTSETVKKTATLGSCRSRRLAERSQAIVERPSG